MRWGAVTALVLLLGLALAVSYLFYRQLDTKTVVIAEAAQLQPNAAGALCGSVDFELGARTLGRWLFPIKVGQQASGSVTAVGNERDDIGLRVWSPGNRLVLDRPVPQHSQQFQFVAPAGGDYLFEFDNRRSVLAGKHVTVSLCLA
jgi:hypothetical protein